MSAPPPRPIRVVHVVLDLHEGGLERVVVDLARGMAGDRFESRVLCLRRRGQLAEELPADDVKVVTGARGPGTMLFPREVSSALASLQANVVHMHSGVWFKAARAARLAGIGATAFTDHGRPWPDPWANRTLDYLGSRGTRAVVAVSAVLREYLIRRIGIPAEKIQVIRNGVAPVDGAPANAIAAARRSLALPDGAPLIGSVGRLDPVKAYDVLLRAVAILREGWQGPVPPCLVIVGDGPDRSRLERMIGELGLAESVRLTGWLRDVQPVLGAIDVFVLSSDSEGTSVSLLEAMQAARPVVATAVGGSPDVLGPDLAGQLVPAQAPAALAQRLSETLADSGHRGRLGRASRVRVEVAFSQRRMFDAYRALYAELAIGDPRRTIQAHR